MSDLPTEEETAVSDVDTDATPDADAIAAEADALGAPAEPVSESVDDDDAPEGSEARDEEFEGDDPADIPDEHGGTQAGVDTDDNGVDDTVLPEGTDRIVDTGDDDWE